jgi:hypothetical protein
MKRYMIRLIKTESGKPMVSPINLGTHRGSSPFNAVSHYLNEEAKTYPRRRIEAVEYEEEKTLAYRDNTVYTGIVLTKEQVKILLEQTKTANQ